MQKEKSCKVENHKNISSLKQLGVLLNPLAMAEDKADAIRLHPNLARISRTIQALIPTIFVGIAALVVLLKFHSTWNWIIHNPSWHAELVRYGLPSLVSALAISIGIGAHYRDKNLIKLPELNLKNVIELFVSDNIEYSVEIEENKTTNGTKDSTTTTLEIVIYIAENSGKLIGKLRINLSNIPEKHRRISHVVNSIAETLKLTKTENGKKSRPPLDCYYSHLYYSKKDYKEGKISNPEIVKSHQLINENTASYEIVIKLPKK